MPRKTKKKMSEKDWEKFGMKMMAKKFKCNMKEKVGGSGCGGAIYGLGFLGALIYYVSTAPSFWEAVIGILKSLVWPAIVVYEVLKFLGL